MGLFFFHAMRERKRPPSPVALKVVPSAEDVWKDSILEAHGQTRMVTSGQRATHHPGAARADCADAAAFRRNAPPPCRTCRRRINRPASFHWTLRGPVRTLGLMLHMLSPREVQVLELLSGGACNKHIARELDLSTHTVKRHVARTMLKLHVGSRAEAACLYRRERSGSERLNAGACALRELTAREREVLARVAIGASNDEIAAQLALSPNTVKRHTANIREKLGVHSRVHAAALIAL